MYGVLEVGTENAAATVGVGIATNTITDSGNLTASDSFVLTITVPSTRLVPPKEFSVVYDAGRLASMTFGN